MSAIGRAIRALGFADVLVIVGALATLTGSAALFGWAVTALGFGIASIAAGIILGRLEAKG